MVPLWGTFCCMVEADAPICAHLTSLLGGHALLALSPFVPLFDAILLSDHTEMGRAG